MPPAFCCPNGDGDDIAPKVGAGPGVAELGAPPKGDCTGVLADAPKGVGAAAGAEVIERPPN